MRYFVITDSTDTQVGLRLAGVEGVVVREPDQVRQAIQTAAADREIGVLLITEKLAAMCQDLIAPMKLAAQRPLVVEIPDRHSAGRASDSITRYIREAIGIKL
ncbi:V-type ATP synthase subunit F [uncultured Flavonifractor sp.]|uniref:V-type ATP synthase subunit F n=1 Tax=uncultured Flavonifractor sp. TaxID=1193534 RepID=UPI0026137F07|nr:V-type ATP synthase subunit F [uncultured Flavonifractor sp.]